MFAGWIQRIRLHAAAKKYARLLGPKLIRDYGSSTYYTPAQIQAAVGKLKLPAGFLCLGQAAFLPEDGFAKIGGADDLGSYAALRNLFDSHKPARAVSAEFGQATENIYAGGGPDHL